jgi:hypothetical protein
MNPWWVWDALRIDWNDYDNDNDNAQAVHKQCRVLGGMIAILDGLLQVAAWS